MKNKTYFSLILSGIILVTSIFPTYGSMMVPKVDAALVQDNPPSKIDLTNIFTTPIGSNSTVINNNIVQLTPALENQKGGIWSTVVNKMDLTKDFSSSMYLYFGNQGSNAADGIAFVMHNDPRGTHALSPNFGSGLGVYAGETNGSSKITGIQNSFAVEFDTYINNKPYDGYFDTNVTRGNHVAWSYPGKESTYIDYNVLLSFRRTMKHNNIDGNVGVQFPGLLSNDTWRKFTVKWDSKSSSITYQLQGLSPVTVPINVIDVFDATSVYWGFTGSTGGNFQMNRVAFDQVPGLVNGDVNLTIKKEDNSFLNDQEQVLGGKILTYNLNGKYYSGLQDWTNITANTTLDNNVTYIPGSMKITNKDGTRELSDSLWTDKSLKVNIGNMNTKNNDVTISFKVLVNKVNLTTPVTQDAYFYGNNANYYTLPINFDIIANQTPETTISQLSPIHLLVGEELLINGTWYDPDDTTNTLMYELNGSILHSEKLNNPKLNETAPWSYLITSDKLKLGENNFKVTAVDNSGLSETSSIKVIVESPPKVSLNDANKDVSIEKDKDFTISGTWNDLDSDSINLYYSLDNGIPILFANNVPNTVIKGDDILYSHTIQASQLPIGTHQLTVYGVDDTDRKSNIEKLTINVTGNLTFTNVPTNVSFENMEIPSEPVYAKRNNEWDIRVKDTRGTGSSWRVTATLGENLSDGQGHYLKGALKFIDRNGNSSDMPIGVPVNVYEHNSVNTEEVTLNWQDDKGILLKITPSIFAGNYNGTISWCLVDGP